MTEKTAQQINRMKEQTIGVEVEMNNITRKAAAKLAAEFFGTNRSEYTGSRNGYETYSAWDAQGREWKFQRDCSISGPDSFPEVPEKSMVFSLPTGVLNT